MAVNCHGFSILCKLVDTVCTFKSTPPCIFEYGDQVLLEAVTLVHHDETTVWPIRTPVSHIMRHRMNNNPIKYISIDLNGNNGAIKGDIAKDLTAYGHDTYDIVTNFGTTEHVETLDEQYECFKNMHDLCCVGGFMIHEVPMIELYDRVPDHSPVYYSANFFKHLKEKNEYYAPFCDLVREQSPCDGHLMTIFQKINDNAFIVKEEFPYDLIDWKQDRGVSGETDHGDYFYGDYFS
jgi:hypothetical protein